MRSCNQLVAELLSDQVSTQSPSQNALTLERNGTTNGMFGFPVVVQSCLTLCSPMNCSTLGFPIIHYLSEFAQTRVHWVNDTIQPSHPLPPLSPPALHLSQHQGLFQWYPVLINKIFPIHLCSMGWSLDLLRPFRKKKLHMHTQALCQGDKGNEKSLANGYFKASEGLSEEDFE